MTIHNVAGFDWNHGNLKKCQKHGVEIAEIESAFRQTMAVFPDPTHSQGEDRFIGIGKTHQGRSVFIAFILRLVKFAENEEGIIPKFRHKT